VRHFCKKVVGPLCEGWRNRFREMKTAFENFSFPSGKHLISDPFIRCVRALANLATIDGHCHHPLMASTAFVEGTHFALL